MRRRHTLRYNITVDQLFDHIILIVTQKLYISPRRMLTATPLDFSSTQHYFDNRRIVKDAYPHFTPNFTSGFIFITLSSEIFIICFMEGYHGSSGKTFPVRVFVFVQLILLLGTRRPLKCVCVCVFECVCVCVCVFVCVCVCA